MFLQRKVVVVKLTIYQLYLLNIMYLSLANLISKLSFLLRIFLRSNLTSSSKRKNKKNEKKLAKHWV